MQCFSGQVGLMRNGFLLAEESPGSLLRKYQLNTLEDVFLKLCRSITRKKTGKNGAVPSARGQTNKALDIESDDITVATKEEHGEQPVISSTGASTVISIRVPFEGQHEIKDSTAESAPADQKISPLYLIPNGGGEKVRKAVQGH